MNQQETGGFKLLEEDALDDRPCPAVKKFVASVLDRKDMKDQEVASSFRNLMEYRDSAASPSACSVRTTSSALEGDRLNSPPSPSSPTTGHAPMDDQRLPNELFDEICEDIGMKEGMELDFVEYLMEQDTNPHMYLTQEAISSGAFSSANRSSISTPTGSASGSSNSGSAHSSQSGINNNNQNHHNHHHLNHHHHNNNNNESKTLTVLNPPVATTTPNFLFKQNFTDSDWINQLPMSVVHPTSSSNSSGSTTVQSSENNSPVNKRVHLSISTDTSPNKGRSQTPPGFNQHNNNCGHSGNHNLFKLPQTGPLMTKRSHSYPQGAPSSSPVQSINSSDNSQASNSSSHSSSTLGPHASDQEGLISSSGAANNKKKTHPPGSPKPALPSLHPPGDSPLSTPSQAHYNNSGPGFVGGRDGSMFQPVGKPAQTPISVKSMQHYAYQQQHHVTQQQRWIGPPHPQAVNHCGPGVYFGKGGYAAYRPFQQHQPHPAHTGAMGPGHLKQTPGPPETHLHPIAVPTTADSPLDQGYFSNESAGNCSSSAPSPAFTTSSMSSFSSVSTILPVDSQVSSTPGPRGTGQKSVHFADMPQESPPLYSDSPGSISEDVKQPFAPAAGVSSDCAFQAAAESNGQPKQTPSGKIMPRFHHSMKSGVAPYTVPNNQGQLVGPQLPPGYEMATRPSCALSVSGERSSPNDPMQDYMSKPTHMNGGGTGGNGSFYMDGNQNMMRMESTPDYPSLPPPLISPQPGEFVGMPTELPRYRINQFAAMQQQQSMQHSQQSAHIPNSSCEPAMPPLQAHHHHHHHHHHPHPLEQHQAFSSCSYLAPGMNTEMGPPPHQNNMQISHNNNPDSYHLPASPAISNKPGSNGRLVGPYGAQMCSAYENIYEQRGRPAEIYPSQPAMSSPQGLMVGQPNHRGWGAEDLRVQVSGMQSSPSPAKGSLQPAHSQSLPHMQPSPTPACAAPAAHMQEISLINSGMHVTAPGLVHPAHPHMGPHPEYGPCLGLSCHICKMSQQAGGPGPPHPLSHIGPCPNPNCHTCKMSQPCAGPPPTSAGVPHAGPCAGPGCGACKMNQVRPYKFIQRLVMDPTYQAYRSHPLFSLLRDLVIAEKYFNSPEFCHQQLLNTLPDDFNRLLQNFLTRNPPTGHYQTDQGVESVIMDSLRLAHSFLLEKIRHRQELEKMKANSSASLRSMEEFCQKFDHSVTGPMGRPGPNGAMGMSHPMAGYHEGSYMQHGVTHVYRSMKDGPDVYGDSGLGVGSPQAKTESKKHPSLPKEAVAMMMEWLRNHKDNPYPNDDEKAMLIKQTGLSINQINYWFTNARRRILPKWAQCNKT